MAGLWAGWYARSERPSSTAPSVPWYGQEVVRQRSPGLPADGRSTALLHRIAHGTGPV
ncbi:hypothetical protein ACFW96_36355 [Streptomyces gardneri]|uniref:hypothetical protein n=1 Tax=Streptomyces gardneri TaxID=66892 RepID=UPI0036809EB4